MIFVIIALCYLFVSSGTKIRRYEINYLFFVVKFPFATFWIIFLFFFFDYCKVLATKEKIYRTYQIVVLVNVNL